MNFVDKDIRVTIKDTGIGGHRYEAKIELWIEGNEHPTFQYYEYGSTKEETVQKAKDWIIDYRAEIR